MQRWDDLCALLRLLCFHKGIFNVLCCVICKWKFRVIIVEALQNCGVLGHEATLKNT